MQTACQLLAVCTGHCLGACAGALPDRANQHAFRCLFVTGSSTYLEVVHVDQNCGVWISLKINVESARKEWWLTQGLTDNVQTFIS